MNHKELEQAKTLSAIGNSFHAIGQELGRDHKTIKKALTQSPVVVQEVKEMKKELSDIFEGLAKRMIESITEKDIKNLNAYQRTLSSGISIDKMRLLRDQSTQNISFRGQVSRIKELQEGIEALRKELETEGAR